MNILGVIAEFNPFHNGHHYLLQTARQQCRADYTVIVMSGNFTQRGEAAIYDKFIRTRMALSCGADLVIEMPSAAATSSARDFARTGVGLLAASGVVRHLAFGCENMDLPMLNALADILIQEPPAYKAALKDALKKGESWPSARSRALVGTSGLPAQKDVLSHFLKQPNNILALEYLMALKDSPSSGISPVPVQRIHAGYHDTGLDMPVCSATALRHAIFTNPDTSVYIRHFPGEIQQDIKNILQSEIPVRPDDFSQALIYRLLTLSETELCSYLDMDDDLVRRIKNHQNSFTGFDAFCDCLCTRSYTRTRISRVLIHTLLGIKKDDQKALIRCTYAPYLRILGFRKSAAPLLGYIKSNSHIPMITRPVSALKQLKNPDAARLFAQDIFASDLYRNVHNIKAKTPGIHEFQNKIIIL